MVSFCFSLEAEPEPEPLSRIWALERLVLARLRFAGLQELLPYLQLPLLK